ncbi:MULTISPECIES: DUF3055 domain-containing protein [Exiguobacterium]|uniref:DUF3055 domain-containing protein n=1 Tax=Exiguobacterium TaxID=33986 RepID=UPI00047D9C8B|nr:MULTISPECIES: DUF3055 domain-containing protein [Exiguobacterium]MCK2156773.1 DUF3055 domain-containing protein [Exiguobacterium sp. 17-1]
MESQLSPLEELYHVSETDKVRFIGVTTEQARYDFGVIFTKQFFGKMLVVSLTSGRAALLDHADVLDSEALHRLLGIDAIDAETVGEFLATLLPYTPSYEQAD